MGSLIPAGNRRCLGLGRSTTFKRIAAVKMMHQKEHEVVTEL